MSDAPLRACRPSRNTPRKDRPPGADYRRRRWHGLLREMRGGRRHRSDRDLQLRSVSNGRAGFARGPHALRRRQPDRHGDGRGGAAGRQADAGSRRRERDRSFPPHGRLPGSAEGDRFSGVQHFPTVGIIDGSFRANLQETGMSYGLEVDVIAKARAGTCCRPDDRRLHRGGDGAQGQARRSRPCAWRAGCGAGRRHLCLETHQGLPRLLRRVLDGAAAGGSRAEEADGSVQGNRSPTSSEHASR